MVDGKFAEGMVALALQAPPNNIQITHSARVAGNQIGRQRQALFDYWADNIKSDWILWVDSDIVVDIHIVAQLMEAADAKERPIVSGVYFISKESEGTLGNPMPALFTEVNETTIRHLHPLPKDALVQIDSAGMGLVLMHKSIVPKLREVFPNQSLFAEIENLGDKYIGEDIVFFQKVKKAGIPVFAWTGALVKHMKRFSFDVDYYSLYWGMAHIKEQLKKQNKE
jgi:GT2 family glycosyltransferase